MQPRASSGCAKGSERAISVVSELQSSESSERAGVVINTATGIRTRVVRVRAECPYQLDYSGLLEG